jgi:hypothetical protein
MKISKESSAFNEMNGNSNKENFTCPTGVSIVTPEQKVAQATKDFCNAMNSIKENFTECTCPSDVTDVENTLDTSDTWSKLTPEQIRIRALNTNFFRIAFMGSTGVPSL